MASLKEIFERAQQTGKVEYTYFGGNATNVSPFTQTSIPFGKDIDYGAGSSKQPYIRLGYDPRIQFRTDDPTNTYNTLLATGRDVVRITKFFTDFGPGSAAKGPLWLLQQSGLQFSNPDTAYAPNASKLDQLDSPRIYNPLGTNTLASVGGNGLGLHFTRHGLTPTNDVGYISLNQEGGNFLSRLNKYNERISGVYAAENGPITLTSYKGGPDSFYGIGTTKVETYTDQFNLNTGVTNKKVLNTGDSATPQYMGFQPWSYQQIKDWGNIMTKNPLVDSLDKNQSSFPIDFRKVNDKPQAEDYPKYNLHTRIGMTTPADPKSTVGPSFPVDSINIINITPRSVFYGNSNPATKKMADVESNLIYSGLYDANEIKGKSGGNYGRDIIKFRIELLNNDMPVFGGEINTDVLAFRAYLDSLGDDFQATWKDFNYMGRGESFYTYEKFSRKINFSFILMAHSKYEMPAIYTKLNYLMSSFAPDYNSKNQMRGTYAYLTIGDYIYQQPGVFTSMQISELVGGNSAPWEIQLSEPENRQSDGSAIDKFQHEVPTFMKVSMNFNPIHNFLPRKNHRDTPHTATFITPNWKLGAPNYYLPQGTTNRPGLIAIPEEDIKQPANS